LFEAEKLINDVLQTPSSESESQPEPPPETRDQTIDPARIQRQQNDVGSIAQYPNQLLEAKVPQDLGQNRIENVRTSMPLNSLDLYPVQPERLAADLQCHRCQ